MIWIDSDGGVDDALAIAVACKIVSGHKIAFSTVFGNVSARQAAHNIRTLLHRLGVDAPILVGAERASDGFAQSATDIHGLDGLGNVIGEVRPDEQFDSLSESIESPLERARWLNEDVHILSIGPATNIPSIARMLGSERISGITMMTGAIFDKGNITEDAEFNAYNDPIALANILHSGIPITIVPLDICRKLIFRREDLTSLSTFGAAAPMLSEAHKFYMASYEQAEGISGCFPHDTIALLSMLYPSKFNFWRIPFDVDSSTDHRGQLRFDINGAYHARFCLGGDLRWVRQFMRSWSILA